MESAVHPLSSPQELVWSIAAAAKGLATHSTLISAIAFSIVGTVDYYRIREAVKSAIHRYDALRQTFDSGSGDTIQAVTHAHVNDVAIHFQTQQLDVAQLDNALIKETYKPFDISSGPFFRVFIFRLNTETSQEHHVALLSLHHIIGDEYSLNLLWQDIVAFYNSTTIKDNNRPPAQYSHFAEQQRALTRSDHAAVALSRWKSKLHNARHPFLRLPLDRPRESFVSPSSEEDFFFDDTGKTEDLSGGVVQQDISPALKGKIDQIARKLNVHPRIITLAAWHMLLAIYSGNEQITVGVELDMRKIFASHSMKENVGRLVGCVLNPAAIIVDLPTKCSFAEAVKRVSDAMSEAERDSAVLPFQHIAAAAVDSDTVGQRRSLRGNPLYSVDFQYYSEYNINGNWPSNVLRGTESVTPMEVPFCGSMEMELSLCISRSCSRVSMYYASALFDECTVLRMLNTYIRVLSSSLEFPNAPRNTLDALTPQHRAEIARVSCGPRCPERLSGKLPHEAFLECAVNFTDSIAIRFEGRSVTYGEAKERACSIASALDSFFSSSTQHNKETNAVLSSKVVGVMMERCVDVPLLILAIWLAGGVYVPLDPAFPRSRLQAYIKDACVDLVLTQKDLLDDAEEAVGSTTGVAIMTLDSLLMTVCNGAPIISHSISAVVDRDAVAYVIFTSGTTGRPKGVMCTYKGLKDFIDHHMELCISGPGRVFLLSASINFDPHLAWVLAALCSGATLVIAAPSGQSDPSYIADLVAQEGIHAMEAVPTLATEYLPALEHIAEGKQLQLDTLVLGGEELPLSLARSIQESLPFIRAIYNQYGPTETTVNATTWRVPSPSPVDGFHGKKNVLSRISLGYPDANMRCYVVDPSTLCPLPLGAVGELILSGPRVAKGYIGKPELTAAKFISNPCASFHDEVPLSSSKTATAAEDDRTWDSQYHVAYRTGDIVSYSTSDGFAYLGRVDEQVKVNGVRIELGEVQAALASAPGIQAARVTALSDIPGNPKELIAAVVPADVDVAAVLSHCRSVLSSSAVPLIQPVPQLKILPSGKLDVQGLGLKIEYARRLSLQYSSAADRKNDFVPPSGYLEIEIAAIWQDVLGKADTTTNNALSATDDFFAVGGNSLKAGLVMSRLRQTLNMPTLPATTVYVGKTIQGIAMRVQSVKARVSHTLQKDFSNRSFARRQSSGTVSNDGNDADGLLSADCVDMQVPPGQRIPKARLPYILYLLIQFIFLAVVMISLPLIWGLNIVAIFALYRMVPLGALFGLWPVLGLASMIAWMVLLVGMKWVLVQRLTPGIYPLYGWVYLRWITMRALHMQASLALFPFIRRTSLLPLLFRLMGSNIENIWDTIIDTFYIFDYDLITIKKGARVFNAASASAAFVAPAGHLTDVAVLVLSPVYIGENCQLGHSSVVPAGTSIPDHHNLKPHTSPAHPGCEPTLGRLSDYPHFVPESEMHWFVSIIGGILSNIFDSAIEMPAVALVYALIGWILGINPLNLLPELLQPGISWVVVLFSLLFSVAFQWVEQPVTIACHLLLTLFWKWTLVGRLHPGRNVNSSKWTLFCYSILRRMVESPRWLTLQETFCATPVLGAIYRLMGATVGEQAFLGGLLVVEFDALTVGKLASAANNSRVYCIDEDGTVLPVVLDKEASIGNSAVLFPGSILGSHSIIGNDTAVYKERKIPPHGRLQGELDYEVNRFHGGRDIKAEEALGLPRVVTMSASGVKRVHMPIWYIVVVTLILFITFPATGVVLWGPLAVVVSIVSQQNYGLLVPTYLVMVAIGTINTLLWLRFLKWMAGIEDLWKEGSASVFALRAQLHHSFFHTAHANLYVFQGTPFMVWIYRALGFTVGTNSILMGFQPLESKLVSFGKGVVVDSLAYVNGHYMEFQRFIYNPTRLGDFCWVQLSSRVMPATLMRTGSRVLPGTLVLPGDTIAENTVWGGLPAEPIAERQTSLLKRRNRKKSGVFKRAKQISRHIRNSKSFQL